MRNGSNVVSPANIFIDINNTIYATSIDSISIWIYGNNTISDKINTNNNQPVALFKSNNNNIIYATNSNSSNKVINQSGSTVWTPGYTCGYIFIDRLNQLYCSISSKNQITKKDLFQTNSRSSVVVAGSLYGSNSRKVLNQPKGIFVSKNLTLYVADSMNDRIQMFQSPPSNGITVVGSGASGTFALRNPTDVAMDNNNFLFIVDAGNDRIIGSDRNGFRCIIGCSKGSNLMSQSLLNPKAFSFDTEGNIYVIEGNTTRVQKFTLVNNSAPGKFCENMGHLSEEKFQDYFLFLMDKDVAHLIVRIY